MSEPTESEGTAPDSGAVPAEAEQDAVIAAATTGVLQLGVAVVTLGLSFAIDHPSTDVLLLIISMVAGAWATVAGLRTQGWLVAFHGLAVVALNLITLVAAPL